MKGYPNNGPYVLEMAAIPGLQLQVVQQFCSLIPNLQNVRQDPLTGKSKTQATDKIIIPVLGYIYMVSNITVSVSASGPIFTRFRPYPLEINPSILIRTSVKAPSLSVLYGRGC